MCEKDNCPICFEELGEKNLCITKCGHKFCFDCMFKHLNIKNDCPLCRAKLIKKNKLSAVKPIRTPYDDFISEMDEIDTINNENNDSLIVLMRNIMEHYS